MVKLVLVAVATATFAAVLAPSRQPGVSVRLFLEATGPVFRGGELMAILNPSERNERVRVTWTGRGAAGTVAVGSVEYGGTSWGEIGTLRWWERLQAIG